MAVRRMSTGDFGSRALLAGATRMCPSSGARGVVRSCASPRGAPTPGSRCRGTRGDAGRSHGWQRAQPVLRGPDGTRGAREGTGRVEPTALRRRRTGAGSPRFVPGTAPEGGVERARRRDGPRRVAVHLDPDERPQEVGSQRMYSVAACAAVRAPGLGNRCTERTVFRGAASRSLMTTAVIASVRSPRGAVTAC